MRNPAMHIVGRTNIVRVGPIRFQSLVDLHLLRAVQREWRNALEQGIGQREAFGLTKSQRSLLEFG